MEIYVRQFRTQSYESYVVDGVHHQKGQLVLVWQGIGLGIKIGHHVGF